MVAVWRWALSEAACKTSGLSCHVAISFQHFIHSKEALSTWHASFVTRCKSPASATTASMLISGS